RIQHAGPDVNLEAGSIIAEDLHLPGDALAQQFTHLVAPARAASPAHANLVHVQEYTAGMQILNQQSSLVLEDPIKRRFRHADGYLRVVEEHRVVPTHSQMATLSDAAAREQFQGRRLAVIVPRVKMRILQGRIILALGINNRPILTANSHRCAGPAEHVNRADLLDAPVIQPNFARLAAPNPGINRDLVEAQAVEEPRQL